MSVGIEMRSSTDHWMDGVADGIVHRQVDNQIVETTVGGTKVLCINTLIVVRTVVNATHRRTTQMSVGVETGSGTDDGMNSVTDSVVHG